MVAHDVILQHKAPYLNVPFLVARTVIFFVIWSLVALAVTRLSDFLRYTLDKDPMKRVSLRQEIDALNLYLGIEKLRFGDRLKLSFDIEDAAYQIGHASEEIYRRSAGQVLHPERDPLNVLESIRRIQGGTP